MKIVIEVNVWSSDSEVVYEGRMQFSSRATPTPLLVLKSVAARCVRDMPTCVEVLDTLPSLVQSLIENERGSSRVVSGTLAEADLASLDHMTKLEVDSTMLRIASIVSNQLPQQTAMIVLASPFGINGVVTYISNVCRGDAARWMMEVIQHWAANDTVERVFEDNATTKKG